MVCVEKPLDRLLVDATLGAVGRDVTGEDRAGVTNTMTKLNFAKVLGMPYSKVIYFCVLKLGK